ncbi:MAG: alpha/beta fold hydrolase, partial [Bacteroidota bacterium]
MAISQEAVQIPCADGVVLQGKLLIPDQPRAVVQFNAGTAAKKEFYQSFLTYLAENGFLCCLWDYRGSGETGPQQLKGCDYTFRDYGTKDMPAVKAFLRKRFPDLPLLLVGHSAGGQQAGMMPDMEGIRGMIGIAVSTGYAPGMPFGYRLQALFFFHLFSPVSIALADYVAAKRFGIMEDLPRNVVREWRDWCSKPDYLFDPAFYGKTVPKGHYEAMPFP